MWCEEWGSEGIVCVSTRVGGGLGGIVWAGEGGAGSDLVSSWYRHGVGARVIGREGERARGARVASGARAEGAGGVRMRTGRASTKSGTHTQSGAKVGMPESCRFPQHRTHLALLRKPPAALDLLPPLVCEHEVAPHEVPASKLERRRTPLSVRVVDTSVRTDDEVHRLVVPDDAVRRRARVESEGGGGEGGAGGQWW